MAGSLVRRGENRWLIRWEGPRQENGRRRQLSATIRGDKHSAERALRERLGQAERGVTFQGDKLTLKVWLDGWLDDLTLRSKTVERYKQVARDYIAPLLGNHALTRLTPAHIKSVHRSMQSQGLAASSVELAQTVLLGALKAAAQVELVERNVAVGISPPARVQRRYRMPPVEQVRGVVQAAEREGHPFAAAFRLVVMSGLRRGECLGLQWRDVEWEPGQVRIEREVIRDMTGIHLEALKTERSRRVVELDVGTLQALRDHRDGLPRQRQAAAAWLFANERGEPLNPDRLSRNWKALGKRFGLDERFHDLRHFHASAALAHGADLFTVSRRLGHANIATTADTYGHLLPGQQRQAVAGFVRLMDGEPVKER